MPDNMNPSVPQLSDAEIERQAKALLGMTDRGLLYTKSQPEMILMLARQIVLLQAEVARLRQQP